MSNRIEIRRQVHVYHRGLVLYDRRRHPVHRPMGRAFWPVPIRALLKVSLEDRFQYQLQRPLHHTVPDGGYPEDADFAPILRYLHLPVCRGPIGSGVQFVMDVIQERLEAGLLDGRERHTVNARGTAVASRHLVGLPERLRLTYMNVQPPEAPFLVSLRLEIYSPSQVLQTNGRLCHPVLASLVVGELFNSRAPLLRGSYTASTLLHAPPPPSRLRLTSRCCRL